MGASFPKHGRRDPTVVVPPEEQLSKSRSPQGCTLPPSKACACSRSDVTSFDRTAGTELFGLALLLCQLSAPPWPALHDPTSDCRMPLELLVQQSLPKGRGLLTAPNAAWLHQIHGQCLPWSWPKPFAVVNAKALISCKGSQTWVKQEMSSIAASFQELNQTSHLLQHTQVVS